MLKSMKAKLKSQSGFSLVELIVVLVILAILAALLVPALLGYIDRARSSKYLEEARSIYTAIQAVQDENYAKNVAPLSGTDITFTANDAVNKLVAPTVCTKATIKNKTDVSGTFKKTDYVVSTLELNFTSQDGNTTVYIKMNADGSWDTDNILLGTVSGTGG